jgi:hypothetical protein
VEMTDMGDDVLYLRAIGEAAHERWDYASEGRCNHS